VRRLHLTPATGVALAALTVAVSGGAYAAATGSPRAIVACVHHQGGGLYVARRCGRKDRSLKWSVTGPAGPAGATGVTGPAGPAGATGPTGPSNAFSVSSSFVGLPGGPATLASLALAPGAYAVTAKTVIADDSAESVYVFCDVLAGATTEDTSATMVGTNSARQTVALAFTGTFNSPTTVVLTCRPTNPATTTNVGTELTKIVAIKVGSETH
jgi:hypothetical protein